MSTSLDLSLIVPAYNEARSIGRILDSMAAYLDGRPFGSEILVSADGEDGTLALAAERSARDPRIAVTGSASRRGKGRAVREAVSLARGRMIAYVDADGKTPIEDLDKLLPWLDGGYDVVIGSRRVEGSCIEAPRALHRRLGSAAFLFCVHRFIGLHGIHDTQCGFKLFRGEVARDLFSRQGIGYMFDVEVLQLAARAGYRVKEVGIRWRDDGDSRLDLASCWRNAVDILRIRSRRA